MVKQMNKPMQSLSNTEILSEVKLISTALYGEHWITALKHKLNLPRSTVQSWDYRDNLQDEFKPQLIQEIQTAIDTLEMLYSRYDFTSYTDQNTIKEIGDALFYQRWMNQMHSIFVESEIENNVNKYKINRWLKSGEIVQLEDKAILQNYMRKRINLLKLILGSMVPNTALISYRVKLFTESKQYTELQSKPLEKDQIFVLKPICYKDKYCNTVFDGQVLLVDNKQAEHFVKIGKAQRSILSFYNNIDSKLDEIKSKITYESNLDKEQHIIYDEFYQKAFQDVLKDNN